jgi:hypothetical protein
MIFSFLLLVFAPNFAQAYIPPSFFIYTKIAEQKEQSPNPSLTLLVSRPAAGGTEEALGTITLPTWPSSEGNWPTLSLLFSSNVNELFSAVEKFGLVIPREQDLLRVSKEQAAAMKDPPRPFYKSDKNMALKRQRQNYAWVHRGSEDSKKSIWIEKDTFLPLKISAPCPEKATELPWAKSGDNLCDIEFRNTWSLRKGSAPVGAKIILSKDGQPLLYFSFEKISYTKSTTNTVAEFKIPDDIREIAQILLH